MTIEREDKVTASGQKWRMYCVYTDACYGHEVSIHVGLGPITVSTWSDALQSWVTLDTTRQAAANLLRKIRQKIAEKRLEMASK